MTNEVKKPEAAKPAKPTQPISDFALFGAPGSYMQAQRDAARRKFESDYDRADRNHNYEDE